MKRLICFFSAIMALSGFSQTQTVTLDVNSFNEFDDNGVIASTTESYSLTTNQVIKIVSIAGSKIPTIILNGFSPTATTIITTNFGTFTGLTNITVNSGGADGMVTFEITTPNPQTVISNYVPADAIVIPASQNGNVQIILESSSDLVNWTAANPGTYSAANGTNRFFRVRAVAN